MRYFVTGATGFIGRHLTDQLVDNHHEVIALVRSQTRATDLPDRAETVCGDIADRTILREGMCDVDGVFHLAGWYHIGDPDPATAAHVNVEGTRAVLEVMADLGIDRGVYTSSLAVFSDTHETAVDESYRYDGPHLSLYDRTKWEAHYEVAEPMIDAGLPLIIVQPGLVYGPGDRGPAWMLWEAYLQGSLSVIPNQGGYCWGHVVDTADAIIRAMERGLDGESYIIAGSPFTLVEIFDIAQAITGRKAPRALPSWMFGLLSRLMGPVGQIIDLPPEYSAEALRLLDGVTYWGDNTKATRELGIEHRPIEDGLTETLQYERAHLE